MTENDVICNINQYLAKNDLNLVTMYYDSIPESIQINKKLAAFNAILQICRLEQQNNVVGFFCEGITFEEMFQTYLQLKYALRRVEHNVLEECDYEFFEVIRENKKIHITIYAIMVMTISFSTDKIRVLVECARIYCKNGLKTEATYLLTYAMNIDKSDQRIQEMIDKLKCFN